MDSSNETNKLLGEIRDHLREGGRRQIETLEFMRAQAQKTEERIERSIAFQQVAVGRQKSIQVIVLPLIAIVVGALVYLLLRL